MSVHIDARKDAWGMLNDRERQILDQTARQLADADPRLSERLSAPRHVRWAEVVPIALAIWATVLTLGLLWLGLIGNAVVFAGTSAVTIWGFSPRRWRLRTRRTSRTDT